MVFSGCPLLCFEFCNCPQSLGTAGTCAGGPDGYRQSPLHQDASIWPKKTDLTGTDSKRRNPVLLLRFFLSWYISLSIRRQVSVKAYQTLSENTDTETPEQKKGDCLLSLCYCDRSVILWGPNKPKNQKTKSVRLLRSTADRTWLLFAHKVRNEVKLVLS